MKLVVAIGAGIIGGMGKLGDIIEVDLMSARREDQGKIQTKIGEAQEIVETLEMFSRKLHPQVGDPATTGK